MPDAIISEFFSTSKAYLIAVGDYTSPFIADLSSPKGDVHLLQDVLRNVHNFNIPSIAFTDQSGMPGHFDNPLINPGKEDLLSFIDHIKTEAADRVILYIACHGIARDDDMPKAYLLAADALPEQEQSFVGMDALLDKIGQWQCRHLLLILDCCYAGAIRWSRRTRSPGAEVPKTIYYERFEQYAGNKAWQVLTSSAHDQRSVDALRLGKREANEQDSHSPFAELLYTALKTGAADLSYGRTPPDGIITVSELLFYLRQEVFYRLGQAGIEADERQVPQLLPVPNAGKDNNTKGEFLFLNPALTKPDHSVPLNHQTNKNPYRGLDPYSSDDGAVYYGRQRVLNGQDNQPGLRAATEEKTLIIVTGPSGIGKSSLIRAGILSLYKDITDQAGIKKAHEIRPGATPYDTHHELLESLARSVDRKIVLVDQYEELITVCRDGGQRTKFEGLLRTLMPRHTLLLTVRSDFENQFKESELFTILSAEDKNQALRFVVPPFSREEIREIVTVPAAQEVLEFKSLSGLPQDNATFVDGIIDSTFQNPGALPLLSLSLQELYIRKDHFRNLLESEYIAFNGIRGILDKKATAEFEKLKDVPQGQEMFRWIIFRMISLEGGAIAKRRIFTSLTDTSRYDELKFDEDEKTQKIKRIAAGLVDARLLRADRGENDVPYLEPGHEALLNSSFLVRGWLRDKNWQPTSEYSKLLLHKSVSDIALVYQDNLQARDRRKYLWKDDPRLPQVMDTISERLNATEAVFVRDSYKAKVRARNRMYGIIGSALALSIVVIIAVYYQAARTLDQAKKTKALSLLELSSSAEPTEAVDILKTAYRWYPDNTDILSKIISVSESTRGVNRLVRKRLDFTDGLNDVISVNDSLFIIGAEGGVLLFQSPRGRKKVILSGGSGFPSVALSPGKNGVLAYVDGPPYIKEFNLEGDLLDSIYLEKDRLNNLDFFSDEHHVYILLQGLILCKSGSRIDTIKSPGGQQFDRMRPYKQGILMGTSTGIVDFYDPDRRAFHRIYKTNAGIEDMTTLPEGGIALLDVHGNISVLNSTFTLVTAYKGPAGDPAVLQSAGITAFQHAKKILIRPSGSGRDSLILWDYGNNKKVYLVQKNLWNATDLSPSERFILSCGRNEIAIHDTSGKTVFQYGTGVGHDLSNVQFVGTDDRFLASSFSERLINFWQLDSTDLFGYDLDGHYDYSRVGGEGNNMQSWDLADGKLLNSISREIEGLGRSYGSLKFRAAVSLTKTARCIYTVNGLALISRQGRIDSFRIRLEKGENLQLLEFNQTGDSLIKITDQGAVGVISINHPDSQRAVLNLHTYCLPQWNVFDNSFYLLEMMNGYKFGLYNLNGDKKYTGELPSTDWTSDLQCTKICYKSSDSTIAIRSLGTGKTVFSVLPDRYSSTVMLSPDGKFLLYRTIQEDELEAIHLYSVKADKLDEPLHQYIIGGPDKNIQSLRFSLDGDYIIAGFDHGRVENYLTPQGAKKWIGSVNCADLPDDIRTKYGLDQKFTLF